MEHYADTIININGRPVSGASVTVRSGSSVATIYSDNGTTPKANPFTTDSTGMVEFSAANGEYLIDVTSPVTGNVTTTRIILFDPSQSNFIADS